MIHKLWAKFLGTFALVFCGTGAIVMNSVAGGAVTHVGISLTFGLVVMVLITSFGAISGAHFNPAVTRAFFPTPQRWARLRRALPAVPSA